MARMVGPSVAARQRGIKMLREAPERTRFQTPKSRNRVARRGLSGSRRDRRG
jgi:hypothetical protein